MTRDSVYRQFSDTFGIPATEVFSPGRANIIGEHTDYNDGFVLPFSIQYGVWFFARPNQTNTLTLYAANTLESTIIDLTTASDPIYGWDRFFLQVLGAMRDFPISGADIVFGGDLPIGAGISSSSSITCGFVRVLDLLNNLNLTGEKIVELAITAERGTGVRGGIMDQYTIVNGKKNQAILLDCRTNAHMEISLQMGDYHLYLINTNVKHNLINTDYNNRRAQCDEAVNIIRKNYRPITALRDLNSSDIQAIKLILPEILFRRTEFVIKENERVIAAVDAIKKREFEKLGTYLIQSHEGLSSDYEVSCKELDWIADYAKNYSEVFVGSRMMGGGFGGCTINLTRQPIDDAIKNELSSLYFNRFGIFPDIFPVFPEDGIMNHTKSHVLG